MSFTCTPLNLFILIFFIFVELSVSQYNKPWNDKYENNKCPKLYPKNFVNYVPAGNLTAGNFTDKLDLKGLRQCVMMCCVADSCNVAFIVEERCYHVECVSDELCLPLPRSSGRKWDSHVYMILVKPVLPNENWSDILDQSSYREVNRDSNFSPEEVSMYSPYTSHRNDLLSEDDDSKFLTHFINNLPNMEEEDPRTFDRDSDSDIIMDTNNYMEKVPCQVGSTDDCPFNSECIPLGRKLLNGICKCVLGTAENAQGQCVQIIRPFSKGPTIPVDSMKKTDDNISGNKNDELKPESSSPRSIQNLTVSILSKQVQLPDNEVTLAAYTIPDEKATMSHYNYVWTLVNQPKNGFTGNMNQNGATVTLTDLTEGQYQFKVTVNGTNSYGEGYANVTVLPPQRINTPPLVLITPQSQTVKLPNSVAVLDGSASKDDDAIISWHWELTSGPIGYQPPLQDGPTLVLNDLKQPGNYTFKLTVEDSDHVKNSTTANITVLNHTDYPPEANAGQDVIIYLPHNNLTLNGSLSTDDHEITSWEWTKSAEDENKAVDMQNTHSPYLQLSNLSEGVYTFVLKVTDSSGQFSTAEVHVFVKPPTNTPPVADAGADVVSTFLTDTRRRGDGTPVSTYGCLDNSVRSVEDSAQYEQRSLSELEQIRHSEIQILTKEIRLMREDLSTLKLQLTEVKAEMTAVKKEMLEVKETLSGCHLRLETMTSETQSSKRITELEKKVLDISSLRNQVEDLQEKLERQAQISLRNEIEIIGITETSNENLTHIILVTAQKVGIPLVESDIDWVSRVDSKREIKEDADNQTEPLSAQKGKTPRPVVVRLVRRDKRDEFLKAAKYRRNLTSLDIEAGSKPNKLYFNERLTRENRQLFRETRNRASINGYKYCWTQNGTIYVRKDKGRGNPAIAIRSYAELNDKLGASETPEEPTSIESSN